MTGITAQTVPPTTDGAQAAVRLPADRPRRPGAVARCDGVLRADPQEEGTGWDPARWEGVAWQDVLLGAFAALLHRLTGRRTLILDVADGTRSGPVCLVVEADTTPRALAHAAAARVPGDTRGATGVCFAPTAAFDVAATQAGLELQLVVHGDAAGPSAVALHYDTSLFDPRTAQRLLSHFHTLLADTWMAPGRPVRRLRLLSEAQLHQMLVEWNATSVDLGQPATLHAMFAARVAAAPDAPALVQGTEQYTYGQTDAAANRIAARLRALGVARDVRVGLCLERSYGLLVSMLAVLKAGGAFVPLDPGYPAGRLAAMVSGADCTVLISRGGLTANLPAADGVPLLLLDGQGALAAAGEDVAGAGPEPAHEAGAGPEPAVAEAGAPADVAPDDLCYVIYTSGSTGEPKPIALCHRGVANNLADLNSRFEVGPGDAVLALSSPSFDMAVYEFLGMTAAGGTVVVPAGDRARDPAHWRELLDAHRVTVWNTAPALLELLVEHVEQRPRRAPLPLRLAMLGGDWIGVSLPDRLRALAPGLRFIALGGATEASIHSTLYEVDRTDPHWTAVPYGRPMANQRTYILDEARRPVPVGVAGELYLAGTGLARGYLDRPEQTRERFSQWSHGEVAAERLYRTGDLARFRSDGVIELLGRADFQVKMHGVRVELGEVEAVLRRHPAVREAVAAAAGPADGDRQLVGYVVPRDGAAPTAEELRAHAAQWLPAVMVPARFVVLDTLPLSPNGKVDRRALPAPGQPPAPREETPGQAPRGRWEERIAAIWQDVLGVAEVRREDNFFALGGDSMKALRSMGRIDPTLNWADVFRNPTVRALAAHLAAGVGAAPADGEDR